MTPADKDLAIEVLLSQEVAKFLALEDNIVSCIAFATVVFVVCIILCFMITFIL